MPSPVNFPQVTCRTSMMVCLLPWQVFSAPPRSRGSLALPHAADVDFRASCFCHKRLIDLGFVCSVRAHGWRDRSWLSAKWCDHNRVISSRCSMRTNSRAWQLECS